MEEILKEILQEMKRQTEQNDKIINLLIGLKHPSGQPTADVGSFLKVLKGMGGISKNPDMAKIIDLAEENIKKAGV